LFGNGDSTSQYGSLIVSCDVVGSSSLIVIGGRGKSSRGPKIFLVSRGKSCTIFDFEDLDALGSWHPLADKEIK